MCKTQKMNEQWVMGPNLSQAWDNRIIIPEKSCNMHKNIHILQSVISMNDLGWQGYDRCR